MTRVGDAVAAGVKAVDQAVVSAAKATASAIEAGVDWVKGGLVSTNQIADEVEKVEAGATEMEQFAEKVGAVGAATDAAEVAVDATKLAADGSAGDVAGVTADVVRDAGQIRVAVEGDVTGRLPAQK